MTFAESTLRWQRWLLAAMLLGSAVLILPPAVEPFMLPKATLIVMLVIVAAGLGLARAAWTRQVHTPISVVTAAASVFALGLLITTITSPRSLSSVIGLYGRYTGLVPYLAYLTVFLLALRLTDAGLIRLLRRTALVALGLVVGYGLLQAAGLEPFTYSQSDLGTTFSFLGNVNFSAAWAGAVAALALTTALSSSEARGWRLYAAAVLPLTFLYVVLTGTAQGPVVAFIALSAVGLVLATPPRGRVQRITSQHRRSTLAAVGGVALVAVAGAAVVLSARRQQFTERLGERGEFYAAAIDIFADRPLVGTGLDTYAHHFQAYRPASHALTNNLATTDAPHSVLLGMFSNGGLVLGIPYLAVIAVVGWALLRGVLRVTGPERWALAGFGGVWVGYQAQALISFDVPPLALLHWLSAGIIVALGMPPHWRELRLPGQAVARPVNRKGKAYGDYVVLASTRVLHGAVTVVALGALWLAAYPLRADLVSASAAPLTASGQFAEASDRFERAARLNPTEPTYKMLAARAYEAAGDRQAALVAAEEAARRDPGTVGYALYAAQQARLAGMEGEALRWYREAVARDPLDPPVLNEAGGYLTELGEAAEAEVLLQRSADLRPETGTFVQLAQARLAQRDTTGARAAAEKALALDPASEPAKQLLARLF
jgi:tetratricopeptide (TPR) repeat protein